MRCFGRTRRVVYAPLALLLFLVVAGSASAELAQNGDLFVHFDGGISPRDLPRDELAPISVRIEGRIKSPEGADRPSLSTIRIGLNRGGRLDSRGLPVCGQRRIVSTTPAEALSRCGSSLVGTGGFTAKAFFPEQAAYVIHGEILLFNSTVQGHAAILGHVFQTSPTPVTRFIVFHVSRGAGAFGTEISSALPVTTARNGYLTSISLQVQRRFVFMGRPRSYISASCATPAGVSVAAFPFARVSMGFTDGRSVGSTLTRTCRVR
jgi:hypothetical protein